MRMRVAYENDCGLPRDDAYDCHDPRSAHEMMREKSLGPRCIADCVFTLGNLKGRLILPMWGG